LSAMVSRYAWFVWVGHWFVWIDNQQDEKKFYGKKLMYTTYKKI
jgi:hypothetical protein